MSLTVFANIYLDSEIRLQRMKDSFHSFKNSKTISEYVINLRGQYSDDAKCFLEENIRLTHKIFQIESAAGWFYDSKMLLDFVSHDTVFIWIEDHICLDAAYFDNLILDFKNQKIDYLQYSFWLNGITLKQYDEIEMQESNSLYFFTHDNVTHQNFKKKYINSLVGIYSKSFMNRILQKNDLIKLWPPNVPFDFERPKFDTSILPFKRGVSKKEVFASIDDDQDVPNSSLISRGLYKSKGRRMSMSYQQNSLIIRGFFKLKRALSPFKKIFTFIKLLIYTPINFFLDYTRSIYLKEKYVLGPIPWMNYRVINYLVSQGLVQNKKIFEFGSGSSTHFWLKIGASEVISVEHDEKFYQQNSPSLSSKCQYLLIPPQISEKPELYSEYDSFEYKGYNFRNYVNKIDDFEDEYFDLIVIDGRARSACLSKSIKKLKKGGVIIFDNANRLRYAPALQKLEGWETKTFIGSVRGLLSLEVTQLFKKN